MFSPGLPDSPRSVTRQPRTRIWAVRHRLQLVIVEAAVFKGHPRHGLAGFTALHLRLAGQEQSNQCMPGNQGLRALGNRT